jgi:hypothetical protein
MMSHASNIEHERAERRGGHQRTKAVPDDTLRRDHAVVEERGMRATDRLRAATQVDEMDSAPSRPSMRHAPDVPIERDRLLRHRDRRRFDPGGPADDRVRSEMARPRAQRRFAVMR